MRKKRLLSLLLALCMAFALLPGTALAEEPEVVTIKAPRTIEELNAKWATLKPVHTEGTPYVIEPDMDPYYTGLGQVKSQVLYDGLNTLNFARYMAGLTGDVSLLRDFNVSTQYASVLLAFRDSGVTHWPEKPDKISSEFYEMGYEGTTNSNLTKMSGRYESTAISHSVKSYLSDLGESYRDRASRRYSALDPLMTATGFGMATSPKGDIYSAMWTGYGVTLNGTGTQTTDYEAVTWPAAGYHATDFYDSGMQWSVLLNENRYNTYKLDEVQVTVTGPNGTSVVSHVISPKKMIIFTPADSVQAGQKYKVEISGLYRDGKLTTLKYSVEFFDLSEPGTSSAELLAIDKIAVEHAVKEFSYVATNYTKPEDVLNCVWAETKYIDRIEWVSEPIITKATTLKEGSLKGTLKYTLNGESLTFDVNMRIPVLVTNDDAYVALTAAKAMTVNASTTQEDVEFLLNIVIAEGCTVSVSRFSVKPSTATETGSVSYEFTVSYSNGEWPDTAIVIQVIPVLGREILNGKDPSGAPSTPTAPTEPEKPVEPEKPARITFTDVPDYFMEAVSWAVEKNITSGYDDTTFGSNDNCSQAQILTFLWRAKGSPEPTTANPFGNLDTTQYYAKPAIWAYEQSLISGGSFDANGVCTRGNVATYLWQLAGSPKSGAASAFTDVPAQLADAVAWAAAQGITQGLGDGLFGTNNPCTRGEIVTFLYRAYK